MDFELSTGKTVKLKQPTIEQRIECNDAKSISFNNKTGEVSAKNTFKTLCLWACAGLGCDLKDLAAYSDAEISEIGNKVSEMAALNPSKPQS